MLQGHRSNQMDVLAAPCQRWKSTMSDAGYFWIFKRIEDLLTNVELTRPIKTPW